MEDLDKRIAEANEEFIAEEPENLVPAPVDIYQHQRNISREYGKKQFPRGARAGVLATIKNVIQGFGTNSLARVYKRASDDIESLRKMGEDRRAQLVANQYMQESFLPAVEVVVNFTSPDELLNSEEGLKTLDKYALGIGGMNGYTAGYVREAYGDLLGKQVSQSEPDVANQVRRINGLLDTGQNRVALAIARKLKEQIDKGERIASEADYDLISLVNSSQMG